MDKKEILKEKLDTFKKVGNEILKLLYDYDIDEFKNYPKELSSFDEMMSAIDEIEI